MISVNKNNLDYEVKIADESVVDLVFKVVSKGKNITKFLVEELSLNEIFIEKVGETYEK